MLVALDLEALASAPVPVWVGQALAHGSEAMVAGLERDQIRLVVNDRALPRKSDLDT